MEKKTSLKKVIPVILVTVIVVTAVLAFVQKLVMPKYQTSSPEGSMIEEYYDEYGENDVIFFGDCEVYEVFSPVTLWEEYGITSYVRGTAQQLVWMSYYYMEETLKYEKPKVMVFAVNSLMYGSPDGTKDDRNREAYNRMSFDGMRWSAQKWRSINVSMTTEEREKSGVWSYVFPILRFHDRILELTGEDIEYLFKKEKVTDRGYLMQVSVEPMTADYSAPPLVDYTFSDLCIEYLDRMVSLCAENDIRLVFVKSPTKYPVWYDEYEEQIEEYTKDNDILYINLLECEEDYGINWQTDTYDAGLHPNVYGVEKISGYFGRFLMDNCDLEDHRKDGELSDTWEDICEAYHARKAALEEREAQKENN